MFKRILIANRGEIAVRIAKTCKNMGIETVSVYSDVDDNAMHVRESDHSAYIGPSISELSYLNIDKIIQVSKKFNVDAIHPGYGFLSENPNFSKKIKQNKLIFIGPSESSMKSMAYKSDARKLMETAGVPVLPGFPVENITNSKIIEECNKIGFPLIIKASAGGGGKGMHVINSAAEILDKLQGAKREALSSFGDDRILIEKYLENPRHVEVQIVADNFGNVKVLSDRDCSIQRRHQKVVEEAPAPFIKQNIKDEMAFQAIQIAKEISYSGAGTIEFLYEKDKFYFMEMNTRLQVEHPVTEKILNIDLVEIQIRISNNESLENIIRHVKPIGHALEVRVYAENPEKDFLPSPGKIKKFKVPSDKYVRLDSGYDKYDEISSYYDPMIAKIIVYGRDRKDAIKKMSSTLNNVKLFGVDNNVYFLNNIVKNNNFLKKDISTKFIDYYWQELKIPSELKENFRFLAVSLILYNRNNDNEMLHTSPWENKNNWRHLSNDQEEIVLLDGKEEYLYNCKTLENGHYVLYSSINESQIAEINYIFFNEKKTVKVTLNNKKFYFDFLIEGNEYYLSSMGYSFKFLEKQKYGIISSEDSASNSLDAPVPGKVAKIFAKKGQVIKKGSVIVVIEAMKMEHSILAPYDGVIKKINVKEFEQVEEGLTLIKMDKKND